MTHREQVDAAVAEVRARGVRKSTAAPPAYRIAWALGIPLRPPHYQSFLSHASTVGLFTLLVSVAIVLGIWAVTARVPFGRWWDVTVVLVPISVVGGFCSAAYYGMAARWHGLPAWEEFAADEFDAADW